MTEGTVNLVNELSNTYTIRWLNVKKLRIVTNCTNITICNNLYKLYKIYKMTEILKNEMLEVGLGQAAGNSHVS